MTSRMALACLLVLAISPAVAGADADVIKGNGTLAVYESTFKDEFLQLLGSEMKFLQVMGRKSWMPLKDACSMPDTPPTGCEPEKPRCASEQAVLVLMEALKAAGHDTSDIIGASYGVKWLEADEELPFGYVQTISAAAVKKRRKEMSKKSSGTKLGAQQYILPKFSSLAYLSDGATPAVVLNQAMKSDGEHQTPSVASGAWVVFPKRNKHVLFDGNLQRGMPLLRALGEKAPDSGKGPIICFIVSWWRERPSRVALPFVATDNLPKDMTAAWRAYVTKEAGSYKALELPLESVSAKRRGVSLQMLGLSAQEGKAADFGAEQLQDYQLALSQNGYDKGQVLHVQLPPTATLRAAADGSQVPNYYMTWGQGQRQGVVRELDWEHKQHKHLVTRSDVPVAVMFARKEDWYGADGKQLKIEYAKAAEEMLSVQERDGMLDTGKAGKLMNFFIIDPDTAGGADCLEALKVPEDRVPTVVVMYNSIIDAGIGELQMMRKDRQMFAKNVPLDFDHMLTLFEYALSGGKSSLKTKSKNAKEQAAKIRAAMGDDELDVDDEDDGYGDEEDYIKKARKQQNPEAVSALEAAKAIYNTGLRAAQEGNLEQAVQDWVASIKQYPLIAPPFAALAQWHQMNNEYDDAVNLYEQALEIDPTDQTSMYNLGNLFFKRDPPQYREATKFFRKAVEVRPTDAAAIFNCAIALQEQNRFAEQVHFLERGSLLNPKMAADLADARRRLEEHIAIGDAEDGDDYAYEEPEEEAPKKKKKSKRRRSKKKKRQAEHEEL